MRLYIYIFLNKLANKVTSSTALIIFIILLLSKCHGKQASLKKHTHLFVFFALYVVLINNMCILSTYAHIHILLWGFYICYKRISLSAQRMYECVHFILLIHHITYMETSLLIYDNIHTLATLLGTPC